jgi:hypothetical protein
MERFVGPTLLFEMIFAHCLLSIFLNFLALFNVTGHRTYNLDMIQQNEKSAIYSLQLIDHYFSCSFGRQLFSLANVQSHFDHVGGEKGVRVDFHIKNLLLFLSSLPNTLSCT